MCWEEDSTVPTVAVVGAVYGSLRRAGAGDTICRCRAVHFFTPMLKP